MDLVLNAHDRLFFTRYVYPKDGWAEDDILRQFISLAVLVNFQAVILYFAVAGFSYVFLFNKKQMEHPLFLKVSVN